MSNMNQPKLRNVDKIEPDYPLGRFPSGFVQRFGKEIVFLLATKSHTSLEGEEWEQIFASCIDAVWKPSNVGLDDIQKGVCAWGAKTVYSSKPHDVKQVRLISGRNSPAYSFDEMNLDADPQVLGGEVLSIWNARVSSVRKVFAHLRTVVLVKSKDLTELAVFEFPTILYPSDLYVWRKNKHNNLEGLDKESGKHKFTWQPHGSQFTIIEDVPTTSLLLRIKSPKKLDKDEVLSTLHYDESWVTVIQRGGSG